jgi:Core-2/I-Branching enzyme
MSENSPIRRTSSAHTSMVTYVRIAVLVLNHRPQQQLMRLLAALRRQLPDSPIVVHHDKFRADFDASALASFGNAHLLTSAKPTVWGDFSLVDSVWRSITWMTEHVEFDWVIQLSAQDYPIKSLVTLERYLATTGADVLLQSLPINDLSRAADRRDRRRRYLYQYRPMSTSTPGHHLPEHVKRGLRLSTGPFVDVLNNIQPYFQIFKFPDGGPYRLGWRARSTPFTATHPCRFGSNWFSLSYRGAEFLAARARDRTEFANYYSRTIMPGESATATLICNAPELRVEPHDLHYTRWSHPKTAHPDVFTAEDLGELVAAPQYFARKFDIAKDSEILDKLDEVLADTSRPQTQKPTQLCPTPNSALEHARRWSPLDKLAWQRCSASQQCR